MTPRHLLLAALALAAACAAHAPPRADAPAPPSKVLEALRAEAAAVKPLLRSDLARAFVEAVDVLPPASTRIVYRDGAKGRAYTEAEAARLPDVEVQGLSRQELAEDYYYTTKYGSPVSYALPFEILGAQAFGGVAGKKILDYGYGYVGHLRMLAALGAEAHGVDVDPVLRALYSAPEDTGTVAGRAGGPAGRVALHTGRFPEEGAIVREIASGYDLFLSKNTLKRGYVHPSQPVDPKMTLQLKVTDEQYVRAVWELLAPGGWVLIYNLSPAQKPPGEGFIPWAEGETPFPRELWERAGFEVLAFDQDDSARARAVAHALGWDSGEEPMELARDLFALYTLARKPPRR